LTELFQATTFGEKIYAMDWILNRFLVWNQVPATGTAPADAVIGQRSFTTKNPNDNGISETSLYEAYQFLGTESHDFVADTMNHRIIIRSKP